MKQPADGTHRHECRCVWAITQSQSRNPAPAAGTHHLVLDAQGAGLGGACTVPNISVAHYDAPPTNTYYPGRTQGLVTQQHAGSRVFKRFRHNRRKEARPRVHISDCGPRVKVCGRQIRTMPAIGPMVTVSTAPPKRGADAWRTLMLRVPRGEGKAVQGKSLRTRTKVLLNMLRHRDVRKIQCRKPAAACFAECSGGDSARRNPPTPDVKPCRPTRISEHMGRCVNSRQPLQGPSFVGASDKAGTKPKEAAERSITPGPSLWRDRDRRSHRLI